MDGPEQATNKAKGGSCGSSVHPWLRQDSTCREFHFYFLRSTPPSSLLPRPLGPCEGCAAQCIYSSSGSCGTEAGKQLSHGQPGKDSAVNQEEAKTERVTHLSDDLFISIQISVGTDRAFRQL